MIPNFQNLGYLFQWMQSDAVLLTYFLWSEILMYFNSCGNKKSRQKMAFELSV